MKCKVESGLKLVMEEFESSEYDDSNIIYVMDERRLIHALNNTHQRKHVTM